RCRPAEVADLPVELHVSARTANGMANARLNMPSAPFERGERRAQFTANRPQRLAEMVRPSRRLQGCPAGRHLAGPLKRLPASSFQLPASSFQLPASSFQLPASGFRLL